MGLWRGETVTVLLYRVAELFCFCWTLDKLSSLGNCLLAACQRTWVVKLVFVFLQGFGFGVLGLVGGVGGRSGFLLAFPIAVAQEWVPRWDTPPSTVHVPWFAASPASHRVSTELSSWDTAHNSIQQCRTDHAELGCMCCKAAPTSVPAQPEPFPGADWRSFHF